MNRILATALLVALTVVPAALGAQEVPASQTGPWWWQILVFVLSLPYTLFMVFVEGERLMLQLEWTSSLFGAPLQEQSWKAIQPSGPLADLQAGHPRVFDAFYGAPRTELSD